MTKREFLDTVFALAPNEADAIMDAFDEYVESTEPHWIPVEQALPEIGEYVLCQTTSHYFKTTHCFNNYHVCQFVDKDKWIDKPHFDWDRDGFPHVIAWMPLPEPMRLENK